MAKPFDVTLKSLLEDAPEDWPLLAGVANPRVAVIDADISTISGAADKVLRLEGPRPWLHPTARTRTRSNRSWIFLARLVNQPYYLTYITQPIIPINLGPATRSATLSVYPNYPFIPTDRP